MSNLCNLCPNLCNVDRTKVKGSCGANDNLKIAKYYLHPFEEPFISGENGSGTIFFTGCSLKCVFCQNYELSRNARGIEISIDRLVEIFKELEDKGAHNINLVTATHFADKIIKALEIYKPSIPIVYNTHAYENLDVLAELDKYVDVYLPDLKFFSPDVSFRYTGKKNYFDVAINNINFMANKKLNFSEDGMIKSGTVVRHLVLPQNVTDSKKIINALCQIKDKIYLNVMSQYTPFGEIDKFFELQRKLTKREYETVIDYALSCGFTNLLYQKQVSADTEYIPKWDF